MDPPTWKTTKDLEYRLGRLSVAQSPDLIRTLQNIDSMYREKQVFHAPHDLSNVAHSNITVLDIQRRVIVFGHGLHNDDKYFRTLGISHTSATNIAREANTRKLVDTRAPVRLKTLLAAFKFDAGNLNNAGNDALYVLQAFAGMMILKRSSPGNLTELLRRINGKVSEKHNRVVATNAWGRTSVAGMSCRLSRDNDATASEFEAPIVDSNNAPAAYKVRRVALRTMYRRS